MPAVRDDGEARAGHHVGHSLGRADERRVLFADDHERRGRVRGQPLEPVIDGRELPEHRGDHRWRHRKQLAFAELDVAGSLGANPEVGRSREPPVGLRLHHLLPLIDAVRADEGDRPIDHPRVEDSLEPTVRGVHEDERFDAVGRSEQHVLGDHPAHRVAEKREAAPPERVGQREDVSREDRERVRALVVGLVARAVPAQVRCDHVPAALGERHEEVSEVFFGSREAMDEHERPPAHAVLGNRQVDRTRVDDAFPHAGDTRAPSVDVACGQSPCGCASWNIFARPLASPT